VRITYDPAKRAKTLAERELDFEDAAEVFAGPVLTARDDRWDYGEERDRTFGYLRGRMVHVAWTPRGEDRHVMSMRKCNDREQARLGQQLGEARRDDR
jgi:uncharacterized protein